MALLLLLSLLVTPVACAATSGMSGDDDPDAIGPTSNVVEIPDVVEPPVLSNTREGRFPSREDRLKVYMSNWYVPPCPDYMDGLVRYSVNTSDTWPVVTAHVAADLKIAPTDNTTTAVLKLETAVVPDTALVIDAGTIIDCLQDETDNEYKDRIAFRKNMQMYCIDAASTVLTAVRHVDWEQQRLLEKQQEEETGDTSVQIVFEPPPTIVQFGDLKHSHFFRNVNIPIIKKFRSAALQPVLEQPEHHSGSAGTNSNDNDEACLRHRRPMLQTVHNTAHYQPIVWKLASRRHYGNLEKVYREDTAWDNKNNMAVFRGQLTGSRNDGFDKSLPDVQNCLNLKRCRLVYTHANSTLIHAKLTSTRNRLPDIVNGVNLVAGAVTIRRLLAFKAIIMLEGNDVASGLKWALLSQSVVLMPVPKHTSWAMEELLEPWVHYIPLNDHATDVEEKMQWVVDNDETARRISERATLWMEDLVFHPDAAADDRWIQEEIIRRYRNHFVRDDEEDDAEENNNNSRDKSGDEVEEDEKEATA